MVAGDALLIALFTVKVKAIFPICHLSLLPGLQTTDSHWCCCCFCLLALWHNYSGVRRKREKALTTETLFAVLILQ